MMGSLKTWTLQDAIDEMMLQRAEMGRGNITFEEAIAVKQGAVLLLCCVGDEDEIHIGMFEAHLAEVDYRIRLMLEHNMFAEAEQYGTDYELMAP